MISVKLKLETKILILTIIGTILLIAVFALLWQIDGIVHISLYNYGLQFSNQWAVPYWTLLGSTVILLLCILYIDALSMLYLIRNRRSSHALIRKNS